MADKVRVASISDVPPGSGKELAAAGRVVALFNVDGQFYALDGVCPHAGGPLVSAGGPTTRLHVYGSDWNLAPDRYQTIW